MKNFLKNFDFKNNKALILILLIGIIFMTFPAGTKLSGQKTEKNDEKETFFKDDEKKLKSILSDINGAGSVSVMVTYDSGPEIDIAYDTDLKTIEKGDDKQTSNKEENAGKKAVMASGEPVKIKDISPKIRGVVVCADGAGDPRVKSDILGAVSCAMGIAPHRVCIVEKK